MAADADAAAVARATNAIAALPTLSTHDKALLATLRNGHRRWRLDAQDWDDLTDLLLSQGRHPASGYKQAAVRASQQSTAGVATGSEGDAELGKLALRVLLRGRVIEAQPRARENVYIGVLQPTLLSEESMVFWPVCAAPAATTLLNVAYGASERLPRRCYLSPVCGAERALRAGVAALPPEDVETLLTRWRTLDLNTAERAAHRVLRYGCLRPSGEPNASQAHAFVTAGLTQVCSWTL